MKQLSASERNPLANAEGAIIKSEKHLAQIEDSLKLKKLGGGKKK
jgi:hypothetical protein